MAVTALLRVMLHRDAEAIVLETGKVPTLRRRGQIETLAMPALDAAQLTAFAAEVIGERALPATARFIDDKHTFECTFDRTSGGLRVTARPIAMKPAPVPVPAAAPAPVTATPPAPVLVSVPASSSQAARARLAELLHDTIALAGQHAASDLFLSTHQPPRMRVDGRLITLDTAPPLDDAELAALVAGLGANADHSLEIANTRLRVNTFDHLNGVGLAMRLIRDRIPSTGELGIPAELTAAVEHRDGLVLVCGPTGSGKSTTLAALIDLVDQRRAAHVITLEDPIEYRFHPTRCLVHQREVGYHVASFHDGLRAALREAPDVILLGELRDRETIATALTAAETGHLVLATLHAPNATGAIDRIIDAFPDTQQRQVRWQLAAVLRTVFTQYLLPRRAGGRALAFEHVPVNTAVANIMRKGELHTLPTVIQSGRDAGMIPLERSLARLLDANIVAPEAVQRLATAPELLAALATRGASRS
jgi:twitching motility protein PilT